MMSQKYAVRIAEAAMKGNPDISKVDFITVGIHYGYNIGIASKYDGISGQFSPDDWQSMYNTMSF
ncbi:MAG: hypothetical protein ABFD18_18720 [Syntrophomonas sp.]